MPTVAPGSELGDPARRLLEPGHDPQQRRLAGAVRAEHADLRAGQERERDVRQHLPVGAVELVGPVHREDVVAHGAATIAAGRLYARRVSGCCARHGQEEFFGAKIAAHDARKYRRKGPDAIARSLVAEGRRARRRGSARCWRSAAASARSCSSCWQPARRRGEVIELLPGYEPHVRELAERGGARRPCHVSDGRSRRRPGRGQPGRHRRPEQGRLLHARRGRAGRDRGRARAADARAQLSTASAGGLRRRAQPRQRVLPRAPPPLSRLPPPTGRAPRGGGGDGLARASERDGACSGSSRSSGRKLRA